MSQGKNARVCFYEGQRMHYMDNVTKWLSYHPLHEIKMRRNIQNGNKTTNNRGLKRKVARIGLNKEKGQRNEKTT